MNKSVILRLALTLMLGGTVMSGPGPVLRQPVVARSNSNYPGPNAQPLHPTSSLRGDKGKLVFEVEGEIYIMNADGSERTRLTDGDPKVEDKQPALSPDGTRIAFSSDRDGRSYNLYAMNIDGQNVQQLTNNNAHEGSPAWSPDGTRIAFVLGPDLTVGGVAYMPSCQSEIYVMNADGSGWWTYLTAGEGGTDPAWSPDGKQIAFSSYRTDNYEIFVMDIDGTGVRQLTFTESGEGDPAWSPDGQFIAYGRGYDQRPGDACGFIHTPDPPNPPPRMLGFDIYLMKPDGKDQVKLTASGVSSDPVWSPDGTRVACVNHEGTLTQLYFINADGSNYSSLTNDDSYKSSPAWSQSGTP